MAETYGFRKREVGRIAHAVRKSEGPQANNGPSTMLPRVPDTTDIVVIVKSYTDADDTPRNRWAYTVSQMKKTTDGIDGWEEITDDEEGLVSVTAYNVAEVMNVAYTGATGSPTILGNGIDVGREPARDFDVAPAPVNRIVFAKVYMVDRSDGTQATEVWFNFNNQLDGECA